MERKKIGLALSGGEETLHAQEWLGYLVMLIALSLISRSLIVMPRLPAWKRPVGTRA